MYSNISKLEIYYNQYLGEGAFAKVYAGLYNNESCAVKIVNIKNVEEWQLKQFRREFDIIRLLQKNPHPNIPVYYELIETENQIIIIMELCRGGELKKIINIGLELVQIKYYFNQIIS